MSLIHLWKLLKVTLLFICTLFPFKEACSDHRILKANPLLPPASFIHSPLPLRYVFGALF